VLSAIMRQNPRCQAGIGPVRSARGGGVVRGHEHEQPRIRRSSSVKRSGRPCCGRSSPHSCEGAAGHVVFDTNRLWAPQIAVAVCAVSQSGVICCVARPAWIFDSIERLTEKNKFQHVGNLKIRVRRHRLIAGRRVSVPGQGAAWSVRPERAARGVVRRNIR